MRSTVLKFQGGDMRTALGVAGERMWIRKVIVESRNRAGKGTEVIVGRRKGNFDRGIREIVPTSGDGYVEDLTDEGTGGIEDGGDQTGWLVTEMSIETWRGEWAFGNLRGSGG